MPIKVFTKENQANGNFNQGQILEKKPIGFPQDGGQLSPYSNLFYWAHAWAPGNDSTIGLHPHRGFEICSFGHVEPEWSSIIFALEKTAVKDEVLSCFCCVGLGMDSKI